MDLNFDSITTVLTNLIPGFQIEYAYMVIMSVAGIAALLFAMVQWFIVANYEKKKDGIVEGKYFLFAFISIISIFIMMFLNIDINYILLFPLGYIIFNVIYLLISNLFLFLKMRKRVEL